MESKLKQQCQDSVGELPNLLLREGGYPHLPTTPIKKEPELTDWISGDLKPTIDGVYKRLYDGIDEVFCKFENGYWRCCAYDIEYANTRQIKSSCQKSPWRGLAKNPEVQS